MKNIQYINAGAGSGKTTRLTEILSEKLGSKEYKPSEVILTTFTELAASEFREKSRERLYNDNHADVAAELDSATIGTVHSVALSFIQKYWYLIGVSPDMKVMSEDDLQVYISESLGDSVEKKDLELRLGENKEQPMDKDVEEKMKFSLAFIENMGSCISTAPISLKLNILGSIFSGKIVFENFEPRTADLTPLVSLIIGKPNDYKPPKTKTPSEKSESVSWGAMWGSNPRHPEPQSGALPTELIAPC